MQSLAVTLHNTQNICTKSAIATPTQGSSGQEDGAGQGLFLVSFNISMETRSMDI